MDDTTIDKPETHSAHSVTLQKMMAEQVQPDIFDPPRHRLKPDIQLNWTHFSRSMNHSLLRMRHPLEPYC